MIPTTKYFDRGDHVLEIRSVSATERHLRRLPAAVLVGDSYVPAVKPKEPGLVRKAANLAKATVKHVAAGSPEASDADVRARWAVCSSDRCGLFKSTGEGAGTCLHASCGCSLRSLANEDRSAPHKLRWAEQACPVGLWGPVAAATSADA